jgi:CheY-like chemotaxis protein
VKAALTLLADGIEPTLIVILSDINMPGMDGLQLLTEVKQRFPSLRLMMVTAYGDDEPGSAASSLVLSSFSPSLSISSTLRLLRDLPNAADGPIRAGRNVRAPLRVDPANEPAKVAIGAKPEAHSHSTGSPLRAGSDLGAAAEHVPVRSQSSRQCIALGFWDTGLNPTPRLRWVEVAAGEIQRG